MYVIRKENQSARHARKVMLGVVLLFAVCMLAGNAAQAQTRSDYLRRFDTNGDGRVSLQEYQNYMSRGFYAMDRNGDGVLTADELQPGVRVRKAVTLETHLRSLARMFDQLDENNDGYLDAKELTAPPY